MNIINVAYLWSLEWYRDLFVEAIKSQKDKDKIDSTFNEMLYNAICISLFEKDKLLFSFLIGLKLMELNKIIDSQLIRFLMTGGVRTEPKSKIPEVNNDCKIWFNKVVWTKIEELSETIQICHG